MKAKYFKDTDTLYLVLRDSVPIETRDLDEDTLLDYDGEGRVVSITLEHVSSRSESVGVDYETVSAESAS